MSLHSGEIDYADIDVTDLGQSVLENASFEELNQMLSGGNANAIYYG